jgi:hypothetical protein
MPGEPWTGPARRQEQAQEVKARLAGWLAPRGLVFNEDKTTIVSLDEAGFDFLGVNVRRRTGRHKSAGPGVYQIRLPLPLCG